MFFSFNSDIILKKWGIMMKFNVQTLGCKVNAYESELIKEKFIDEGFIETDEVRNADVIVINTCTVTNQADSKSRKIIRQARRENTRACLVVCGCMAQNHQEVIDMLDIDILIGNKDKSKLVLLVKDFLANRKQFVKFYDLRSTEFEDMKINNFEGKTRGFVKIQDGCNNFCSYCIIPFVRGNIRSKNIDIAIEEVNCLVNNGYQEIVLTGIHTGSYGDGENYDLTDLIHEISKNENLKRIRISSIEITELDDKFMEELKNNPKICSHFHVPIQSGSEHILKLMNRKYDISEYKKKIAKLREIRENVNITTDLIVGFPEESADDFNETIANLKDIGFSKIHTFPFSLRSGTKAEIYKPISDTVKKERVNVILKLSESLESSYYQKFIDSKITVLVEDGISGFTDNYIKVNLDKKCRNNTFVDVIITDVDEINVNGHVI